ncbi:DNA internalization-related competence protein ComEC/Rec2 [Bacillus sp. RO1]|uniref:DNA internalization-related competence protein ComEC/Rec2 n=1 Tax=Bacillus sp. RO1 TaxID=2722703 RepID=UPI0014576F4E|nr:DNA internalization-related competence protein ComEC/Rec2 [Bacillus sp. RO1]NLP51316.1 DNA internalization-related competence protein ComEC/Rec2 [Bacillus sp. RO1]
MKQRTGFYAYLAIASCLGIAVSRSDFHWGLLILTLLFFYLIFYIDEKPRRLLFLTILFTVGFSSYMTYVDHHNFSMHLEGETEFQGTVHSPLIIDGNKAIFQMKSILNEVVMIEYYLKSEEESFQLRDLAVGDKCIWSGILKLPQPARNPHAFNYKKYLYEQKIHWILSLNTLPQACISPKKTPFLTSMKQVRQQGINLINNYVDQPNASFMISLIFGDRSSINEDILDAYQQLGLVHLLAISGLHVGIITAATFYVGIRIGFSRQWMNLFLLLLLPLYVLLAGGAPSVMRAATMTGVALALMLMKKKVFSIDTIGLACIFVLILSPYYLYHIGFQLSFSVSLSLLLASGSLHKVHNSVAQLFIVSIIAQVASLPLLLYHFYQFSLWSPLLNVIFVPFYSLYVLPVSFLLFFILLLSPDHVSLLVPFLSYPLKYMNSFAVGMAEFPIGTLVFGKPSILLMTAYGFSIVFFFYKWEVNKRRSAVIVLILCMVFHWNINFFNPFGKVVVLDIGQGDAIFIRLPFNKGKYLIDTGGSFTFPKEEWEKRKREFHSGSDVLVPFLKAEGVRQLDKLILTHGDFDHTGNVESLWGEIGIEEVIVPKGFGAGEVEQEIMKEAKRRGVSIGMAVSNTGWKEGESSFLYLHPTKYYDSENEGSIVLFAVLGKKNWLFTGDIGEKGERDLLHDYPNLNVDVLKVGHHGSNTSSTAGFLDTISPDDAIISVGRNNRFGHPHQDVLDRLSQVDAKVYRTDLQGAILFDFTHRGGTFSTLIP